jgi:hypothetical protein
MDQICKKNINKIRVNFENSHGTPENIAKLYILLIRIKNEIKIRKT